MPKARAKLAKLTPPRLHAPVKRTRLFKLLDRRKQQPIVWVSGPAGSGKSTLVASYLAARKHKTHWLLVDESDQDPATLFYYLAQLANQASRSAGTSLPALTPDFLPDLEAFARRFFRLLFARLGTSVVVLDNCHAAASPSFLEILRVASKELPLGSTLIFISRSSVPEVFARAAAHRQLLCIGWNELRLDLCEAQLIAASAKAKSNAADIIAMHERSGGWVAGLVVMLNHGAGAAAIESKEALFSYFAEELYASIDPVAREVLMLTALAPYTTAHMASSITNNKDAGLILNDLYRKHYFVERKTKSEPTYQYHDLFREFLLEQLARTRSAAQLAALRIRAGSLLEAAGSTDAAADMYAAAKDHANLARLIKHHAEGLLGHGRWQVLARWMEVLPVKLIDRDAALMTWLGVCKLNTDVVDAKRLLEAAYVRLARSRNYHLFMENVLWLDTARWMLGESTRPNRAQIPVLEKKLRSALADHPKLPIGLWTPYFVLVGFATLRGGLLDLALKQTAQQLHEGKVNPDLMIRSADCLLATYLHRADVAQSRHYAELCERLAERDDISAINATFSMNVCGHHAFFRADYARAERLYAQASEAAQRCGSDAMLVVINSMRSLSIAQQGRLHELPTLLAQLESTAAGFAEDRFCLARFYLCWANSWHAWRVGDHQRAYREGMRGVEFAREAGFLMCEDEAWTMLAIYALELDRLQEALRHLDYTREQIKHFGVYFNDSLAAAVRARALLRLGDQAAASAALAQSVRLAARNQIHAGALRWIDPWLPELFSFALEQAIERESVEELIRRWDIEAPAAAGDRWPWPIKIYALGKLELYVDGERYKSVTKAHYRVLHLLKVLIALGGRRVAMDMLAEHLWPEADGDVAIGNLRTAVHRLRKLLAREDAILAHDNKLCLNDRVCWLDTWAFETDCASSSAGSLEVACQRYRGHLLAQETGGWVLESRERLRARFQRCVLALANSHEQSGSYQAVESLLHACLERDPAAEAIYRRLILHLQYRGRHAEALDIYRRCELTLHATLGTGPSAETRAMYEGLRTLEAARQ